MGLKYIFAVNINAILYEKVNDEALKKEIPLKEKVRWGYEIFYGRYTAGILVSGGGWSFKDLSIKKTSTQEIKRGRIYGAVKYNGEWRACVIETVN